MRDRSDVRVVVERCKRHARRLREIGFSAGFFRRRNRNFVGVEIGHLLEDVRPSLRGKARSFSLEIRFRQLNTFPRLILGVYCLKTII